MVMSILIGNFVPHADFSTNHIYVGYSGLEGVHLSPILIGRVVIGIASSESSVQIGEIVVGEDDFIFAA